MRGDRTFGSFRSLLVSTAVSTFCLFSAQSALSSDLKPAATLTLADMASRVEAQLARPVPAAQGFVPLASVGAKGGMPRPSASRPVAEAAGDRPEAVIDAPESYDARLSRIVTQMRGDLEGDSPAQAPEEEISGGQVAGRDSPLPDLAAEPAAVPEELVFRLQDRSEAAPADATGERRFTLVMPAPQAETRAEAPRAFEAPGQDTSPAVPADDRVEFRATGLTLADMAMEATPAPPKQARGRANLPGVPLARLVAPSGGATWAAPRPLRRATVPVRPVPRQRPRTGLSFADPRGLTERFLQGPGSRPWDGPMDGAGDKVWQYPASASLARFLGEMERLPTPLRRHGGRVPLNLEQVARQAEEAGTNATWMGRPNPGFTFSFSREAFAANQLTTGAYGTRRQAVMDELRRVFAPLR